jgi:hypothetical protein
MSMRTMLLLVVEEELRQRAGQLRLAHAGGAEEKEGADRPLRVLQPGPAAAHGGGHRFDRFFLPDDAQVKPIFHMHQLLHFPFEQFADRNAGPFADDGGDLLGVTSSCSMAPSFCSMLSWAVASAVIVGGCGDGRTAIPPPSGNPSPAAPVRSPHSFGRSAL